MCQQGNTPQSPTATTMTDENASFIRQSFLRGYLAPAFNPPSRTCPRCHASFTGSKTMCLRCLKDIYVEQAADKRERERDTFLSHCESEKCNETTHHLGPGWCVPCNAHGKNVYQVICVDCELVMDVPYTVKDDQGGFVDMLKVRNLWCVKCRGLADSWVRMDV